MASGPNTFQMGRGGESLLVLITGILLVLIPMIKITYETFKEHPKLNVCLYMFALSALGFFLIESGVLE